MQELDKVEQPKLVLHFYAVYDNKTMQYMPPFTATNDSVAIRHFEGGLQTDGIMQRNPEDFSLWRVGQWEPDTANMIGTTSECIGKAHELIARMRAAVAQEAQLSLGAK